MTHVAAIITNQGIVAIADGRAMDYESQRPISNDHIKIFELSDRCVMPFAGYTTNDFDGHMDRYAAIMHQSGIKDVSRIAQMFSDSFEGNASEMATRSDWPMEYIFAGYDADRSDYVPCIYHVGKPTWERKTFKTPYGHAGIGWEIVQDILENHYRDNMTLIEANELAARLMQAAIGAHPDAVGGDIRLWDLTPPNAINKLNVDI